MQHKIKKPSMFVSSFTLNFKMCKDENKKNY